MVIITVERRCKHHDREDRRKSSSKESHNEQCHSKTACNRLKNIYHVQHTVNPDAVREQGSGSSYHYRGAYEECKGCAYNGIALLNFLIGCTPSLALENERADDKCRRGHGGSYKCRHEQTRIGIVQGEGLEALSECFRIWKSDEH